MAKEKKIALPDMLAALDRRDRNWYSKLDDEQKKEWEPWITMRFASSVDGPDYLTEHYLLSVNALCNVNYGSIGKEHEELHWLSLQLVGVGKKQLHPFIKPPKKKAQNKITKWLSERSPHLSTEEIDLWCQLNSAEDTRDWAEQLGMSETDIKKIFD